MTTRPRLPAALLCLGLALTGLPAEAMTVGRCNMRDGNGFRPVLLITDNGQTTVLRPGDDGLTRRILFDPEATVAWAAAAYGIAPGAVHYSDLCHAEGHGEAIAHPHAPDPVAVDPAEPEDPDEGPADPDAEAT